MEKVGDLCDLEVGAERVETPQQVICYGAEDKMGNWSWKSGSRYEDVQLAYLFPWLECSGFLSNAC